MTNNVNSLLSSIILYCLFSYLLSLPNLFIGLLFSIMGSQISLVLPKNFRTSLVILIPLLSFSIVYPLVFIPLSIGFTATVFINLLGRNGCMLLYPFSDISFTGPQNHLKRGSKEERAATTFLLVLAITASIFSLYGSEILTEISDNEGIFNYYNHRETNLSNNGNYHYGENNSGYMHYVDIQAGQMEVNRNITTIDYNRSGDNRTTTTIITEYNP